MSKTPVICLRGSIHLAFLPKETTRWEKSSEKNTMGTNKTQTQILIQLQTSGESLTVLSRSVQGQTKKFYYCSDFHFFCIPRRMLVQNKVQKLVNLDKSVFFLLAFCNTAIRGFFIWLANKRKAFCMAVLTDKLM